MTNITPAQRQRAEAVYRAMGNGCALSVSEQEARDVDLIATALAHARRDALREAMDAVGNEMLEETPTNEPDKAYCQAINHALQALDRLAREGVT